MSTYVKGDKSPSIRLRAVERLLRDTLAPTTSVSLFAEVDDTSGLGVGRGPFDGILGLAGRASPSTRCRRCWPWSVPRRAGLASLGDEKAGELVFGGVD